MITTINHVLTFSGFKQMLIRVHSHMKHSLQSDLDQPYHGYLLTNGTHISLYTDANKMFMYGGYVNQVHAD